MDMNTLAGGSMHRSSVKRPRWLIGLLLTPYSFLSAFHLSSSLPSSLNFRAGHTHLYSTPWIDTEDDEKAINPVDSSRRRAFESIALTSAATLFGASEARAGVPELDSATGQLFSPKSEMFSGGSTAARGIPVTQRERLKAGQALQSIYETRFVAYLSRFLLNFDPATRAWWLQQGLADSWEPLDSKKNPEMVLAEFANSVEVGLADYFSGPFGSYSSVRAATAGISAAQSARSMKSAQSETDNLVARIFSGKRKAIVDSAAENESIQLAKQGVLNLCALLKARYTSVAAKRQLAILFSFVSDPRLQPVNEISSLLGEADNASIMKLELIFPEQRPVRMSSRVGGGYALGEFPEIIVSDPPPLGDLYCAAQVVPRMRSTTRVLRIRVADGGEGYVTAPQVTLQQSRGLLDRPCQAVAILDIQGSVDSIIVLDPGSGYGGSTGEIPPEVKIEAPPKRVNKKMQKVRSATAIADLEYEVVGLELIDGGNGYSVSEPPSIQIAPPKQDPDWYIQVQDTIDQRYLPMGDSEIKLKARVAAMKTAAGVSVLVSDNPPHFATIDSGLIQLLQREPLELLPSSFRPRLVVDEKTGLRSYTIPALKGIPMSSSDYPFFYREFDPVFGGVGRVPVTKGASALKVDEYARLALSGAVCTVLVRTGLGPLELIKTKLQLLNDDELFEFARKRKTKDEKVNVEEQANSFSILASKNESISSASFSAVALKEKTSVEVPIVEELEKAPASIKVGAMDLIRSTIELRGWTSLFQSADITFLASLVFGSFGFGATELFRRSLAIAFLRSGSSDTASEIALLIAAAGATTVTAAAAAPLEVLRVRSMGYVTPKGWTDVLKDFLEDEGKNKNDNDIFELNNLKPQELLPLWSGFAPTVSRELPFAVVKFLVFDILSVSIVNLLNSHSEGALPIQVGVGPVGLAVSAAAGAIAGVAGAVVSHPADLILTKTNSVRKKKGDGKADWREVVRDLTSQEGGFANLFVGLGARATFFFLVIGLQFFLYDYVKNLFQVGQDDLSLVLDVFYAVREGLVEASEYRPL
ncbi:hypothetical protein FisN_25Lh139 [Fistulifera solaris]|uniref:Uncharacterized protein n=1 Tax=Fistulifera solaris TaxID=1519565 RepID=A0A1Z5J7N7_FISSO|nr:hypothetical protein FisN_25Lh139 [Fistulifera solaris]|eukprot:GAX10014.1 hypothetical protein FisN_25Lh139 [Fistulifera solaris]